METALDIRRILELLPHRYPFILVDRVLEVVPGKKVMGLKNVTISEPFFQGHFPENPIMPGVLIVEAMAQTGGILAYLESEENRGRIVYFSSMDKVRFRKVVVPGDQLIMELTLVKQRTKAIKMKGRARVDGRIVAEAELMAVWGDKE